MSELYAFTGRKVGVFLGGVSRSGRSPSGRERRRRGAAATRLRRPRRWTSGGLAGRGSGRWASTSRSSPCTDVRRGRCIQAACELARLRVHGVRGRRVRHRDEQKCSGSGGPPRLACRARRTPSTRGESLGCDPPDFGFPLVVKPDREGSTVGITIVRGPASGGGAGRGGEARHGYWRRGSSPPGDHRGILTERSSPRSRSSRNPVSTTISPSIPRAGRST